MTAEQPKPTEVTPAATPPEKTLFGVTYGDYAKMLIAAIIAGIGGYTLSQINSREPYLSKFVTAPLRFTGEKNNLGLVWVYVSNDGSKMATNVTGTLRIPTTTIQEASAAPDNIGLTTTIKGDTLLFTVPKLNATENFYVSALCTHKDDATPDIEFTVRADDVIAVEKHEIKGRPIADYVFFFVCISLATVFGISLGMRWAKQLFKPNYEVFTRDGKTMFRLLDNGNVFESHVERLTELAAGSIDKK